MSGKNVREWTVPAPSWDEIVKYYRERHGRVAWLANRCKVMRGEMTDAPAEAAE